MERFGDKVICNPKVKLNKGESYPLIDIDKINPQYRYVINQENTVYTGQSCSKFEDHDVLFARITPCLENGKMAIASTGGKSGVGSTELFVFRGIKGISNTDYIYYLLCMPYMRKLAANSMTGASGRQRADLNFIKKIPWNYPDISTQERIASILSKYDELIELNNKRIKLLEKAAEELYKEWFVRFRFPNYQNTEFENGIPKGWKVKRYKSELNIVYGKGLATTELLSSGYPVFGSNGIIGYYHNYTYKEAQILISCRGASSGKINISLPCSYITSNSLVCELTDSTESTFEYLEYWFKNTNLMQFQTGSAQPQITIASISNHKILIPNDIIQKSFSDQIKPINVQIYRLKKNNENLISQRDLLLPRLMSGKLEV
ncbi:MAG: restriction endonuclease subunit S [Eubacterium sp.]|nr:restriction endonuclease subunit S [Eubacterium sp.]